MRSGSNLPRKKAVTNGQKDQLQVAPERSRSEVREIQKQLRRKHPFRGRTCPDRRTRPACALRRDRQSVARSVMPGRTCKTACQIGRFEMHVLRHFRPGPNQAHVSFQHIEEAAAARRACIFEALAPALVTRRSPAAVIALPRLPARIVRNFQIRKGLPFLPTLIWLKNTGRPSSSRISHGEPAKYRRQKQQPGRGTSRIEESLEGW